MPASDEDTEEGRAGVDGAVNTTGATPEWRSAMIDVSGLSIGDLTSKVTSVPGGDAADDTDGATNGNALAHCLRRLADDLANPGEPIAGFNSAL
ncbi:hypothetical protein GCM10010435_53200 [Winogradskya consettensis]